MGTVTRFRNVVSANLNSMIEKAEDPEKLLRVVVRDMEDTLAEARGIAAQCLAEKKRIARRIEWLEMRELDWDRKAELAIDKERDDLAKRALSERVRITDEVKALHKEQNALDERVHKVDDDISKLQVRLATARKRHREIVQRQKIVEQIHNARPTESREQIGRVLGKFEDLETKMDQIESRIEAYDLGYHGSLEEDFMDLGVSEQVEKELAEMKSRRTNKGRSGQGSGKRSGQAS